MSWDSIIGQHRIKGILRQAIVNGTVAHAYAFVGPEGIGKDALALEFAKALNCEQGGPDACGECAPCRQIAALQHPNLRLVFALPTGKGEKKGDDPIKVLSEENIALTREELRKKSEDPYHRIQVGKANTIKVNSVRDMKREASLSQSDRGTKVFVVMRADEMNQESANSLLKTLEEPLANTVLLLTTTDRDALLPTIISRCQVLTCDLLTEEDLAQALMTRDSADEAEARLAAVMANGSYTAAREFLASDIKEQKAEVVAFVRLLLGRSRIALFDDVDRLIQAYDKPQLERWLRLLAAWIREGLVLRERGIPLPGSDEATLRRFSERFPHARLSDALIRIDESIAHLDKNIYLPLLLSSLAFDLRALMTGAKGS